MSERLSISSPERSVTSKELAIKIAGPVIHEAVNLSPAEVAHPAATDHEREQWIQRYKEAMAAEMAGKLHEDWLRGRLREDGSYEPRLKQTTDRAWIKAHGTDKVDIANTDYSELPLDWQAENYAAAKVVTELVDDPDTRGLVISAPENPSPVGQKVHEAWLDRNEWAAGGELDVPFDELIPQEQAKDIRQVDIARETFGYTSHTPD
jgi:hypothetical protein